jgi:hypothetical protein
MKCGGDPDNSCQLNYLITSHAHRFIEQHGESYQTINAVIWVLKCAKLELYRRVAVPYEDGKAKQNGDMLPFIPRYEGDR